LSIPSGTPIDDLMGGGIETGLIAHVYGSAGCGKTTLALHVSVNAALLGYDVLYFDTEAAFPAERLEQILETKRNIPVLESIAVLQPLSFREQGELFLRLARDGGEPWNLPKLKVVVVDTIAKHYRLESAMRPPVKVFRELAEKQIPALLRTARKHKVAVLVLNQVSSCVSSTQELEPVGGDAISRTSKYEVKLMLDGGEGRTGWAEIMKTPVSYQIGRKVKYAITSQGIKYVSIG
jgi:DNA repair protein RadB